MTDTKIEKLAKEINGIITLHLEQLVKSGKVKHPTAWERLAKFILDRQSAIEKRLEEAEEIISKIQYTENDRGDDVCHICWGCKDDEGHDPDCRLKLFLEGR